MFNSADIAPLLLRPGVWGAVGPHLALLLGSCAQVAFSPSDLPPTLGWLRVNPGHLDTGRACLSPPAETPLSSSLAASLRSLGGCPMPKASDSTAWPLGSGPGPAVRHGAGQDSCEEPPPFTAGPENLGFLTLYIFFLHSKQNNF